jgi:hypothetical protein
MNKKVASDCISQFTAHSSDTKHNSSRLVSCFSSGWAYLIDYFTRGHEPRVWQKRNSAGDVVYCAYDPYTGRSTYLTSDIDLRIWLEQLPYQ